MSDTVLYALWGGLYALCAALGFISAPGPALRLLMIILSAAQFVPPFVLNYRAAAKKDCRTLLLVRNLSAAWLVITAILLPCNILSVLASETLGNFLHGLLTIVSSPLVCCDSWALSIFLWACVFFDARAKLKT